MQKQAGPFSLFILLLTIFLDWISIGLVYPMFSSMIFDPGTHFLPMETSGIVRGTWLGVLLSASVLGQFFSAPVVGLLSDQKGRKPLIKNTLSIMIFGYLLCALGVWIESLPLLLMGRIGVGIGTGNSAAVYAAIADISKPEERSKYFGLASMASGIGFTLGPFLGGILSSWGFTIPFLFSGAFSLINLSLLILWFKETHHVRREVHFTLTLGIKNLKKALYTPGVRPLFLCFFCFCVGWSFYWEFIPVIWIQEYHLNPSQVGNFYAYGAAFYALSAGLLIRPIVNRFTPLSIFFMALLLLTPAIFLLLMHSSVDVFWGYIPIQQFLLALLFPIGTSLISNSVAEDLQGEIMGILQSVDSFAFAASPLLAGSFVGMSAQTPIIISGTAMFAGSMVLLINYRKRIFNTNRRK